MARLHRIGRSRAPRPMVLVAVLALVAAACSGDDGSDAEADDAPVEIEGRPATFTVSPSIEALLVRDAAAGVTVDVVDADGEAVATGTTDDAGSVLLRDLAPGSGYRVRAGEGADAEVSELAEVWGVDDVPPTELYESQEITDGYQYLETRDGTLLAANVTLPGPIDEGPYPTLVEYSGYDPANPEALQPSKLIAAQLGFATVGVNIRGTGCSGGSFLFYEPAQWTDGYDVVEAVAAQDWVQDGRVGMVGLSYPGISQLFVAQTQPPSLAAIAPQSVLADTYRSTLYPGGILNDGFAISWAEERQEEAAAGGQAWAAARIEEGDETCAANQELRTQNPDVFSIVEENEFVPEDLTGYVGRLAPSEWVDRIEVPVFLAGAWQDEQTGPHFATMLDAFTGAPVTRFTMANGGHTEPFAPEILLRWTEFLDLYVAERVPRLPDGFEALLGVLGEQVFGTGIDLPEERFGDVDSYEDALARYEAEAPVRILFEQGAGAGPGEPLPAFEASFDAWPIPELDPTSWYFDADGRLTPEAPSATGVDEYDYDTSRSQQVTLEEGNVWGLLPEWSWTGPEAGTALAYESQPLDEAVVMAGSGSVDLWLGSTAPDTDLQVVLSEVRPDGVEYYVQSGWLRASHRALDDDRSTELAPYHLHTEAAAADLPAGELTEARVEIMPFAHAFRAGSRIRLSVEGPGGVRPEWRFAALEGDGVVNRVGWGGATPSRVVLPVVPGVDVPTGLPPCPALRGQPCRDAPELTNRAAGGAAPRP